MSSLLSAVNSHRRHFPLSAAEGWHSHKTSQHNDQRRLEFESTHRAAAVAGRAIFLLGSYNDYHICAGFSRTQWAKAQNERKSC